MESVNSTSVGAARLVALRVPLHSEPELMVAIPPGPLRLRPEDPPAVPVRPAPGGLLHESDGIAHKTRDEIVLQKQQLHVHSHFGARRWVHSGRSKQKPQRGGKKRKKERRNSGRGDQSRLLLPTTPPNYSGVTLSGKGDERETSPSWSGESASGTHRGEVAERGAVPAALPGSVRTVWWGVWEQLGGGRGEAVKWAGSGERSCLLDLRRGKVQSGAPRFNKSQPSPQHTHTHTHTDRQHTRWLCVCVCVCVWLSHWIASWGETHILCLLFNNDSKYYILMHWGAPWELK